MARKAQFRPFLPKGAKSYRLYVPGQGAISLDTEDEKEAWTKAASYQSEHAAKSGESNPTGGAVEAQTASASPVGGSPSAKDMLESWVKSSPVLSSDSVPSSSDTQSPQPSQSPSPTITQSNTSPAIGTPSTADVVNAVMPPDRRARLADLLSKVCMKVNKAACAMTVNLMGKEPGKSKDPEDDKDDETLLKEGWAMQLEEWFVHSPPAPWMVIAGGSVSMGTSMYMNGKPKPKKGQGDGPPQLVSVDEPTEG